MTKSIFLGALSILLLLSCGKFTRKVPLVRDCTGVYLTLSKGDYEICNTELVESYLNGSFVKVKYRKVDDCPPETMPNCSLAHESHGFVEVIEVNP